jgi:hypothetical protein
MAFSYYRTITVDKSKVPSDQTNFPVLVAVTHATLKTVGNGGHVQNSSGHDINFTSDSAGTQLLTWELEKYDAATGEVVAWVKIPSLSSSVGTVFYMFYGDSGISTLQTTPANVWDANFDGVYHLKSSGASVVLTDSTSNARNGSALTNAAAVGTGKADGAGDFNAADPDVVAITTVNNPTVYTISAWVKPADTTDRSVICMTDVSGPGSVLSNQIRTYNNYFHHYYYNSAFPAGGRIQTGSTLYIVGSWYQVTVVANESSGYRRLYVNGASDATAQSDVTGIYSLGDRYHIGSTSQAAGAGTTVANWNGLIDEIRISKVERSADWIMTEYNNIKNAAAFYSMTDEMAVGAGATVTKVMSNLLFGV